jgi:formylglycine-generating enzyme required for sulfatase activity
MALAPAVVAAPAVLGPQQALLPLPSQVKQPEMVDLQGGSFVMGSEEDAAEKPPHKVTIAAFSIAKYPVTNGEWRQCLDSHVCTWSPVGDDSEPVRNVSWDDAQQYIAWLSKATNHNYRLPTEAEFEFAARGGTDTKYWWGNALKDGIADCKGCGQPYDTKAPQKVDTFKPNAYGLYGMAGGVDEWVADCWHKNYVGAPANGSAWLGDKCTEHVLRGGSWKSEPRQIRSSSRTQYDTSVRYLTHGFRLALSQ